jgi:hypothetical protein
LLRGNPPSITLKRFDRRGRRLPVRHGNLNWLLNWVTQTPQKANPRLTLSRVLPLPPYRLDHEEVDDKCSDACHSRDFFR